jgi:hypothetical protein
MSIGLTTRVRNILQIRIYCILRFYGCSLFDST